MATEKRLIDANTALLNTYNEVYWTESEAAAVRSFLVQQKTVDAVEVVHGQWETTEVTETWETVKKYSHFHRECKYFYTDNGLGGHYFCPNCGAKMDGERRTDETL